MGIITDLFSRNDDYVLLDFFLLNKLTFPVQRFTTISHASAHDITFLRNKFGEKFSHVHLPHVKHNCFWKLIYKLQTVIIVDESQSNDIKEIFKLMMVIHDSKPSDWTQKLGDNVIKVDFTRKS